MSATLYVVATPIGNFADSSERSRDILSNVDLILAEDTRRSGRLLQQFGIKKPLLSVHEHNEADASDALVSRLLAGERMALISDAGTPAISDPGFRLVRAARSAGVIVSPVPGASAVIAGLSAAGLPTNRFCFEGFLPARQTARIKALKDLRAERRTMVFFESVHRIEDTLHDAIVVFGEAREAALARELTKLHEQIVSASLGQLLTEVATGRIPLKGEFVLMIAGAPDTDGDTRIDEAERLLAALVEEGVPLKEAARAVAKVSGSKRNALYRFGLSLQGDS